MRSIICTLLKCYNNVKMQNWRFFKTHLSRPNGHASRNLAQGSSWHPFPRGTIDKAPRNRDLCLRKGTKRHSQTKKIETISSSYSVWNFIKNCCGLWNPRKILAASCGLYPLPQHGVARDGAPGMASALKKRALTPLVPLQLYPIVKPFPAERM